MAKYLITGGCGFIGSHLATHLIQLGHKTRILDNLSSSKKENAHKEAELLIGDVTDNEILRTALQGVDGCFHLAAVASIEKSIDHWAQSHLTNMYATPLLIDTLRELNLDIPLIFASSAAVYGNPLHLPIAETHPTNPLSPYGVDKLSCEQHLEIAARLFGLKATCFRFFNVYGPGQNPSSSYSGVISIFADKLMKGEKITIFGQGHQLRDFIHVSDVVRFLCAAMSSNKPNPALNVCTGKGTSIIELVQCLEKVSGKKMQIAYADARKTDISSSIGDPSRAQKTFGISAQIQLEEGLTSLMRGKSNV
jgi:UDP-glucose 4-epimerase